MVDTKSSEYRYEHSPKGRAAKRRQRVNYRAKHPQEFKKQRRKDKAALHQRNTNYIREFKTAHPCACGEKDLACLDFHHKNSTTKNFGICNAHVGLTKLKAEINLCEVLCTNCHRKGHAGRPQPFHTHLFNQQSNGECQAQQEPTP